LRTHCEDHVTNPWAMWRRRGDAGCTTGGSRKADGLNLSQNEHLNRGAAALAALTNLKALNLSNTCVSSSALCFFGGSPQAPVLHAVAMVSKTELGSTIFRMDCKSKMSSTKQLFPRRGMVISHGLRSEDSDEDRVGGVQCERL
jgi:hypothetical protein